MTADRVESSESIWTVSTRAKSALDSYLCPQGKSSSQ